MDNNYIAFYALLRAGLWEQDVTLSQLDKFDFVEVYRLAEEQAVVGLIAAGIEHVVDIKVPQERALSFVGSSLQLEQRNTLMNSLIESLIKKLRNNDIYALLVKGQGIAQCYERPLWRASGDIDLLLSDSNYNKAKALLVPLATTIEEEDSHELHLSMELMSWSVELHGTLRSNSLPRMDKVIDEAQHDVFFGGNVRSWLDGKTQVFLPGFDDDIIFVFSHFVKHFFRGGVGLRQICDWCRLLWICRNSLDSGLLESRIKKAGVLTEWKAFASLAVNTLGMPEEAMPLYSSDKKWKRKSDRILKIIMNTGNFGHNSDLGYLNGLKPLRRKMAIVWNGSLENLSHLSIFPLDSIRAWFHFIVKGLVGSFTGKR